MKKIIIALLILAAFTAFSCGKKEEPVAVKDEPFNFRVQFILGDVKIVGASGEKAAVQGDNLAVNDVIITGKKSVADILYGTSGVIRVSENSRLTIASVAGGSDNNTIVNMDNGKVFVTLTKLKGTGFKVKTPTAVASVRGTSFTVLSDKKGAKLAVVKGTVAVNPVKEGRIVEDKSIDVQAGKKTDYIDKKAVEKIIMGKMEIPVMEMTPAEKIEIQSEVKEIKVEEIPELAFEINDAVKQETASEPVAEEKDVKADDTAAKKAQEAALAKKRAEEEKQKADELKRQQEEEAKKLAEEKKKKEEQVKKDRASNIPTM